MKRGPITFISEQWGKIPEVETVDLSGQTVVVIGANTGLGLEATKHFAKMNPARIILGCRSEAKGKAAITSIESETGYKNSELWIIDLAKFSSVVEFAEKFDKDGGRLDYLVMNAGIAKDTYEGTPDEWESTVQVNHLSTSLLSLLLLPHVIKGNKEGTLSSRIVIVSSEVHYWTTISKKEQDAPSILEKIGSQEYCTPSVMRQRYFVSKLLNVLFTRALNARISPSTPFTVDTVNPGYCYSGIRRSFTFPMNIIDWLMEKALALTTEQGSRQLVYATIGGRNNEAEMRGAYISLSKVVEPSDFVVSEEGAQVQDRIWAETIHILSKISPRIQDIVREHLVEPVK